VTAVLHTAAVVVTMDRHLPFLYDGGVVTRGGRILEVGPADALARSHPAAQQVAHGPRWIMPGLHNAHGHLAGWPPDAPLEVFLLSRYSSDGADETYRRAFATGKALVRSGVVWTHHLHYGGHAEETIRGYRDAGLRLQFCLGALDRYAILPYDEGNRELRSRLPPALAAQVERHPPGKPVATVERYLERWTELRDSFAADPDVEFVLGPDNPQWCSDECIVRLREMGVPMHLHCQETAAQRALAVARTGRSPVARLDRLGVLMADVTLAHLTHASDEDIQLVARSGARVVWNPASNLRLGSGVTRVREMAAAGIDLALGVDGGGFADDCDLIAEARLAALLQRAVDSPERHLSDFEVLSMATVPLIPGARADFVIIDPFPTDEPVRSIVRRASACHVRAVFVDGKQVLSEEAAPAPLQDELPAAVQTPLATTLSPYVAGVLSDVPREDAVARAGGYPAATRLPAAIAGPAAPGSTRSPR
jgi:5-methylthioadenosine/S-adenosylhomocysteine deaminase